MRHSNEEKKAKKPEALPRGKSPENKQDKKARTKNLDLLSAVDGIVGLADGSQLTPEFYKKAHPYTQYMESKLKLTKEQCVMLALFINLNDCNEIHSGDIARLTGCSNTHIIRCMNDIDELVRRNLIIRSRSSKGISYRVPFDVLDIFRLNKDFSPKDYSKFTCQELFNELAYVIDRVENKELEKEMAAAHFKMLLDNTKHLRFTQKIQEFIKADNPDEEDWMLLIMFCHLFVSENYDMVGYHHFKFMYNTNIFRSTKIQLECGIHILQLKKFIEFNNDNGIRDSEYYRLTMNAKRELLDELQLPSLEGKKTLRDIIKAADITPRPLFYSPEINESIRTLAQLLEENNYQNIRSRLQEKGFRCGFTCLFYGVPGTGKTETVMQLARQTGRDILQVNISEIKSMWVGETEKNVKAIFDTYRWRVNDSNTAPILLFNEADAIFGTRHEGAKYAVDKMENSIQNIILQELETLDGILIATTNLAKNMDQAFERRFLYKIKFDKPSLDARKHIWHEMLPDLNDKDISTLAERYDFSGGQIENIARHYSIDVILQGKDKLTLETLISHCNNEGLDKPEKRRIGF